MRYVQPGNLHSARIKRSVAFVLAARIALCRAAYAFVTAADFSGKQSVFESSSIHNPSGVAVDGNGNL